MKKIKFGFVFILSLILFCSSTIFAASDYEITAYDVNIDVSEENSLAITETITVYFNTAKHGIVREIPLKNTITRTDGTTSTNTAKVSNVSVSESYSSSKSSSYLSLQIGSSSKTITGEHTYVISYTYSLGKDPLDDADELYFNIIGTEWDTSISNATFTITMPKEFDESLLGFSSGKYGSTSNSNITYSVDGTVITGESTSTLSAGEGITIRLTLPEGYFIYVEPNYDTYVLSIIALSILFVLISAMLWLKFGKDDAVIETVEFYPPEGYNSAEIAFFHDGKASSKGVVSLLVYLANKGYLKIEEIEHKGLFTSGNTFQLTKLKEYDGENENELIFFNGLFKSGDVVTAKDLNETFYTTVNRIKSNINKSKDKILNSSTKWIRFLLGIMIIATFVTINTMPLLYTQNTDMILFINLIISIPLIIIYTILKAAISTIKSAKSKITTIIIAVALIVFCAPFMLVFVILPLMYIIITLIECTALYAVMYLIGVISIVAMAVFYQIMPKRTSEGNKMYGKVKGFKRFIEMARKDELERLVMENPEYFYDVLPYAYALDVSDKWMSQFESIAIEPADWYDSPGEVFRMNEFSRFMNDTMKSASSSMTSRPSSSGDISSGGGSSGGGFSGGGSGGGGGHSW